MSKPLPLQQDAPLPEGYTLCSMCDDLFEPRNENTTSDTCGDCLDTALIIIINELEQRGLGVPAVLRAPDQEGIEDDG